jgi:hypothetical protein
MNKEIKEKIEKLYTTNEYGCRYQNAEVKPDEDLVEYMVENYGIKTDVHRSCVNCQIRQIAKYKEPNTDKSKGFQVRCSGIPKGLPKGSGKKIRELVASSDIDKERATKILLSTIDPVAWAELMFGFDDDDPNWHLRSYQKEQLRCSSLRGVCREGRRSGKTFIYALKLVYLAFNMDVKKGKDSSGKEIITGPEILIITPYQSQLNTIFEEMERLIKRNGELSAAVSSGGSDSLYVKTPFFRMNLTNGAKIKGYVSGMGAKKDGSGGGTIRGASADIIYLDEMDMIPEEILDKVVQPVLLTKPEVYLFATSTPIGKRAKFYQWCVERPDFKEDYYPSTVLPHWHMVKDELEAESTKEGFAAEYMAEFIEGAFGVFRPSWVQQARWDYSYTDTLDPAKLRKMGIVDRDNMMICIGIDWNKNAGTEFFVSGYSASAGRWIALDAINIESSEYSAKRWMQEVIRMNFKWKPNWIYADEGYGHTIIEDLYLYAHNLKNKSRRTPMEEEAVKLLDRLVAFNFSKSVELRDPITGKQIKKAGKAYLVENAVRIMEDGLYSFPYDDETLTKQMLNYIVTKYNAATNKPVYGMDNARIGDHRLDAWMLSLAGLSLEGSIYAGRNLPLSKPGFVCRESSSEDPYISPRDEAESLINEANQRGVPGGLNVLSIIRGQNLKEDKFIKEKYTAQRSKHTRRSRGDIGRKEESYQYESVFEGLAQHSTSGQGYDRDLEMFNKKVSKPHKTRSNRRRGKKSRGWK